MSTEDGISLAEVAANAKALADLYRTRMALIRSGDIEGDSTEFIFYRGCVTAYDDVHNWAEEKRLGLAQGSLPMPAVPSFPERFRDQGTGREG